MSQPREPDVILPLYPEGVPGQKGNTPEDNPWLEVYRAPNPTGAAVVVCPGGGYQMRAPHEAAPIALWLNTLGITGVVLHYRVKPYQHPQPFNDVTRAMRLTRQNAAEWGIDPARVGVLGFSAGGHLASTISVHYDRGDGNTAASLDRINSRPDLSILLYPVITLTGVSAHTGSRRNLLGDPEDPKLIQHLSTDLHVDANTPPMFVFHTVDDAAVPVENVLILAGSLRKAGVPFEMHLYETGRHGVGLATDNPVLRTWTDLCAHWLRARNFAR